MPPDQIEKLRATQDPSGTFHQSGQQPTFLGSDRYGVTTAGDFHGRLVEFQIVKFQHLVGKGRMRSPEKRANAADQLAWGKRLRDIVVGPDVEAERAVSFLAAGAEHDDRKLAGFGARAQRPANVDSRHMRHHPVDDHKIGPVFLDHVQRLPAILGADHLVIRLNEIEGQQLELVRLVISDKDADRHNDLFLSFDLFVSADAT